MKTLFRNMFLLSVLFGGVALRAMDGECKVIDFEKRSQEIWQHMDQMLEETAALRKGLGELDTEREKYLHMLDRQSNELLLEIVQHDLSRLKRADAHTKKWSGGSQDSHANTKKWVELIKNLGKMEVFVELNMIKDSKTQVKTNECLKALQSRVNELVEHDQLTVS